MLNPEEEYKVRKPVAILEFHIETISRLNYLRKRFVAIQNDLVPDLTVTGELYKHFSYLIIQKIDELVIDPYKINDEGFNIIENLLATFEDYKIKMDQEDAIVDEVLAEVIAEEVVMEKK